MPSFFFSRYFNPVHIHDPKDCFKCQCHVQPTFQWTVFYREKTGIQSIQLARDNESISMSINRMSLLVPWIRRIRLRVLPHCTKQFDQCSSFCKLVIYCTYVLAMCTEGVLKFEGCHLITAIISWDGYLDYNYTVLPYITVLETI